MASPPPRENEPAMDAQGRLRRFAFWAAVIGFAFSALDFAVFLLFDEPARGVLSGVTFTVGVVMLGCRGLLSRGRIRAAVGLMAGVLVLGAVVVAVFVPTLFPTAVLVPLISIALALPHFGRRAMRSFVWLSLPVIGLLGFVGYYVESPFGATDRDERPLLVLSLVASASLFLFLLFQHSQRLNDALERLEASNQELRASQERLKELDEMKSRFLNVVAHELNTPLTPLVVQTHLLRTLEPQPLTPERQKSLEILERNVHRVSALVQNVLEVARLQSGRLPIKPETVDLDRLVAEATESFQQPAREAGIVIRQSLAPGIVVLTDRGKMTQIIYNLLSNAIKFTPRHGFVVIETKTVGDRAVLGVRDSGIGLTPRQIEQLFQPFVQVHDADHMVVPGTGLGLYICKGLLEELGGRILVESPGPNRGSTFTIELPLSRSAEVMPMEPASSMPPPVPSAGEASFARGPTRGKTTVPASGSSVRTSETPNPLPAPVNGLPPHLP